MACAGEQVVERGLRPDPQGRADGRADSGRFRRLPGFPGRRAGGAAGRVRARAGAAPRWTSPRIWRREGWFGIRNRRVARWFWSNVGTINSEESVRVMEEGVAVGTLEAAYAERLVPGDRFVLDGRALEFRRLEGSIAPRPVHSAASRACRAGRATASRSRPSWPVELAGFRAEAARRLVDDGPAALRSWLARVVRAR